MLKLILFEIVQYTKMHSECCVIDILIFLPGTLIFVVVYVRLFNFNHFLYFFIRTEPFSSYSVVGKSVKCPCQA